MPRPLDARIKWKAVMLPRPLTRIAATTALKAKVERSGSSGALETLHKMFPLKLKIQQLQPLRLTLKSAASVVSPPASSAQAHTATADYEHPTTAVQPFSAIPGPKPLPVIRNLLEFRKNMFTLHKYLEDCSVKYGDIFKLEAPG